MKKLNVVLILISLFLISSCTTYPSEESGSCNEQRIVTQSYLATINQIKNKAEPTLDDAKRLIKPLSKNFRIDTVQCTGFTNEVVQTAKNVLSQRSDDISDYLLDLCSQLIPTTHDLELIGAIVEQKQAAKAALTYIQKPTDLCE